MITNNEYTFKSYNGKREELKLSIQIVLAEKQLAPF